MKYSFNHEFFSIIDTEEKAYFLGLMYADGNIRSNMQHARIKLQEKDKEILEKFKIAIDSNCPLSFIYRENEGPNTQNNYQFDMYSKKLCEDLCILGCVPVKSLILKFPNQKQVPKHMVRHFIRGYFDGDGCISMNRNSPIASIISTNYFCISLVNIIKKELGFSCPIYDCRCNNITKNIVIYGKNKSIKFLKWIYEDSNIYLERKYNKYLEMKI